MEPKKTGYVLWIAFLYAVGQSLLKRFDLGMKPTALDVGVDVVLGLGIGVVLQKFSEYLYPEAF